MAVTFLSADVGPQVGSLPDLGSRSARFNKGWGPLSRRRYSVAFRVGTQVQSVSLDEPRAAKDRGPKHPTASVACAGGAAAGQVMDTCGEDDAHVDGFPGDYAVASRSGAAYTWSGTITADGGTSRGDPRNPRQKSGRDSAEVKCQTPLLQLQRGSCPVLLRPAVVHCSRTGLFKCL